MSLINYPDIPNLPGVPSINRTTSGYLGGILTIIGGLLPDNLFGKNWGIIYKDGGSTALTPDSFIDFEFREEHRIPNYPIEQGSFQSYNKVALPFDVKVTVSCSGNKAMSKEQFLSTLDGLLTSLVILSVVTPEVVFSSCNLVHVDYRREARNGATLIIAQLWFKEVRVVRQSNTPTASPSGATITPLGELSPLPVATSFTDGLEVL